MSIMFLYLILNILTANLPSPLRLHDDDNPTLVRNEEVSIIHSSPKSYPKSCSIISCLYNLLPKSGEYNHAQGFAPLLIYCLLKGIRVNIPKLIIDYMASEHLMIPN